MSEKSGRSKKVGFKIGIGSTPSIEVWYEQIEGIKGDVKAMRRGSFLKRGKSDEIALAQRFRDLLMNVERGIEYYIWHGKGWAIKNELGKDIDSEFHSLFALVIQTFNEIVSNFDPSKISEELLNHLKIQLEVLLKHSERLNEIGTCSNEPEGIKRAMELINRFRLNLFDLITIMKPYYKEKATA